MAPPKLSLSLLMAAGRGQFSALQCARPALRALTGTLKILKEFTALATAPPPPLQAEDEREREFPAPGPLVPITAPHAELIDPPDQEFYGLLTGGPIIPDRTLMHSTANIRAALWSEKDANFPA